MTPACDTVLHQAGERSKQDTEKTHATLKGVERTRVGTPDKTAYSTIFDPISLSVTPVAGRSPCAHDNNMHTNHTDDGAGHSLVNFVTSEKRRGYEEVTRKSPEGDGANRPVNFVTSFLEKVVVRSARTRARTRAKGGPTFAELRVTKLTSTLSILPCGDYLVTSPSRQKLRAGLQADLVNFGGGA